VCVNSQDFNIVSTLGPNFVFFFNYVSLVNDIEQSKDTTSQDWKLQEYIDLNYVLYVVS